MTHIGKVIILACNLLVASTAIAAKWEEIEDNHDFTTYVDTGSIQINGSVITAWEKLEFKKIKASSNGTPYQSELWYTHTDCKKKTLGVTKGIRYDKDGKAVSSGDYPLDMKPIAPDSIGDDISWVRCALYQISTSK